MLPALHNALARLLYERGGLDPEAVEVTFRQPTRQWADSRQLPTVNCFLFAIEEFTELRNNAMQSSPAANGRVVQRMAPRRYNLRYQVAVWSSAPDDEALLIWRALAVLTRHNPLPDDLLSAEVRGPGLPLYTRIGCYEAGPSVTDLWAALEIPPRPALLYTVVAPLDLEIALDAPLVLSTSLRTRRTAPEEEALAARSDPYTAVIDRVSERIGGVVRDRAGQPVAGAVVVREGSAEEVTTNAAGRYSLRIRRPGPIRLIVSIGDHTQRTFTIDHPSAAYDLTLD